MNKNGEEIRKRTVAFSKPGSHNKVFVTIKDHYTWQKIIERAWDKLSEHLQIPVNELQNEFTLDNKVNL
ncbi:MAG: hypothetical protein Q8K30_05360 [Candidatus Gracilibacteria bacterium]|nr:hypothetical protein [Candidatus Gracilibacteria bacterium]MDP2395360.1 hypothetical protein [bacterium]MDP3380526.1 hypothetical protein [bacterium]